MSAWLTPTSLAGMAIAIAFALHARKDLRSGLFWYAVIAMFPVFQVGAFSGNDFVQGMPLAEVLGTVIIGSWLMQSQQGPQRELLVWERILLLLLPAAALSLVSGFTFVDRAVPQQNVKMSVSIGQLLLFAWPIGVYFVASDLADSRAWRERFVRMIMLMAAPQVVMLAIPSTEPYLAWSTYFGLVAAPLALTRVTYERLFLKKALLVAAYVLPPLIQGVLIGKAFLYGYVLLASLVVLWLRARTLVWFAAPILAIGLLGIMALPEGVSLPGPLQKLVEVEESQQSWGGRAGRGSLLMDAANIWSTHPVFGVGPANSYPYMLRYSVIGTAHSQYANMLLELGIVGFGLFVAFVGGVLVWGWQALQVPRDPRDEIFLVAWYSSFAAMAVISITGDYMLHSIRNGGIEMFTGFFIHWIFFGASAGLVRRAREVRAEVRASGPMTWRTPRGRPRFVPADGTVRRQTTTGSRAGMSR